MTLLNLFNTGGLFEGITGVALLLLAIFGYQTYKAHKSPLTEDNRGFDPETGKPTGGIDVISNTTPLTSITQFWFAVAVAALYLVAVIVIAADYKGV